MNKMYPCIQFIYTLYLKYPRPPFFQFKLNDKYSRKSRELAFLEIEQTNMLQYTLSFKGHRVSSTSYSCCRKSSVSGPI